MIVCTVFISLYILLYNVEHCLINCCNLLVILWFIGVTYSAARMNSTIDQSNQKIQILVKNQDDYFSPFVDQRSPS